MSEKLDICISVDVDNPDVQIGVENEKNDIIINLEKGAVVSENDYEKLSNIPRINSVRIIGNLSGQQLGLQDELPIISRAEIREIINSL